MSTSTSNKLDRIINTKENIRKEIAKQGVRCDLDTPFEQYPYKISQIGKSDVSPDSSWQTSILSPSKRNASYLFYNCPIQELSANDIQALYDMGLTSSTNASYMFSRSSIKKLPDLNLPNVLEATYMFSECTTYTGQDTGSIILPSITNLTYMFSSCTNLITNPDIISGESSITCYGMFRDCTKLKEINLNNIQSIKSADYMFYYCTNLESIKNLNLSDCKSISYLFQGYRTPAQGNIKKLFDSFFLNANLENVYSLNYLFTDSLAEGHLEIPFGSSKCLNLENIFFTGYTSRSYSNYDLNIDFTSYCIGSLEGAFRQNSSGSNYHPKSTSIINLNCPNCTNSDSMFYYSSYNFKHAQNIDVSSGGLNVNYEQMFFNCSELEDVCDNIVRPLDRNKFSQSTYQYAGQNCRYMFQNCKKLKQAPVMDTSTVSNFNSMFSGCTDLISCPSYNISNLSGYVASISFSNDKSYTTSTSNVNIPVFDSVFSGCTSLETVGDFIGTPTYLGNITSYRTINSCFYNCSKLTRVPKIDMQYFTSASNMLYNCSSVTKIGLINIACSLDVSSCTLVGRGDIGDEGILDLLNTLTIVPSSCTLTIKGTRQGDGSIRLTNGDILTTEDIAIATDKGWTIATK